MDEKKGENPSPQGPRVVIGPGVTAGQNVKIGPNVLIGGQLVSIDTTKPDKKG